jgi:hypothetical protein
MEPKPYQLSSSISNGSSDLSKNFPVLCSHLRLIIERSEDRYGIYIGGADKNDKIYEGLLN